MASKKSQKMRIILKAYDHQLIDFAASKLIDTVKKTGAKVSGPATSYQERSCYHS